MLIEQQIALSKISELFSSNDLLTPSIDLWKKIFNNAGLTDIYEDNSSRLVTKQRNYGYGPDDETFSHNDRLYSALIDALGDLYDEQKSFVRLLNSIVEKININNIFIEDVHRKAKLKSVSSSYFDLTVFLNAQDAISNNKLLAEFQSISIKRLRINLNLLNLDCQFVEFGMLGIIPLSVLIESEQKDSLISMWLRAKYPELLSTYVNAQKCFSVENPPGCIAHCRSLITGICSYKKTEAYKWMSGLQKICKQDKNIMSIQSPNAIRNIIYRENSQKPEERYQYPRFNLVEKLYCMASALGAHEAEGNLSDGYVDSEEATMSDALWILRMTEDFLIWVSDNDE